MVLGIVQINCFHVYRQRVFDVGGINNHVNTLVELAQFHDFSTLLIDTYFPNCIIVVGVAHKSNFKMQKGNEYLKKLELQFCTKLTNMVKNHKNCYFKLFRKDMFYNLRAV